MVGVADVGCKEDGNVVVFASIIKNQCKLQFLTNFTLNMHILLRINNHIFADLNESNINNKHYNFYSHYNFVLL